MNRVFISYSRKNQAFAERLAQDLKDAGLQVWIDLREIQGGEDWRTEIERGLETVDFLIACLSPTALESEWVKREIQTVRDRGRDIYPIMVVDSFEILQRNPAWSWLLNIQFINFEDRYEQAFPELLEALPGGRAIGTFDNYDPTGIPNPFKGLEAFQQTDAALFFGREDVTRRAISRLRETHFLAVVGASGSGKSSLVRAGIIPQIRQGAIDGSDEWPVLILSPGAHPLDELARRLTPLLSNDSESYDSEQVKADLRQSGQALSLIEATLQDKSADARLLLVIDQFEEVFTHTGETERVQFLDVVRVLSVMKTSRAHVILTMRADYFGQLSHYPELAKLFEQDNLLIVTEMTPANLVRAIESPAQAVGLRYEQGLVDRLLKDVQSEPGSLPLLQYALHELFQQRNGAKLTNAAYDAIGGVQQALAHHADTIYDTLDTQQQEIMRRVLLRLVDVNEVGEASRRQISRDELVLPDVDERTVQAIINLLADDGSRLITVNRVIGQIDAPVTLQISHEALIDEWDKFKAWVQASLDDLQYEAELRRAANNWGSNEREEAYLLRDKRLIQAEVWQDKHHATPLQRAFIDASLAAQRIRTEQEQARMARELQLQRRATRNALLLAGLTAILLIGVIIAAFAQIQVANALRETQNDLIEQREIAEANATTARQLALSAYAQQAFADNDTDLALSLAVAAASDDEPPSAVQRGLADIALAPNTRRLLELPQPPTALAITADGALFAIGYTGGTISIFDTASGTKQFDLIGHTTRINNLLFSRDGTRLMSAAEGVSNNLRMWDLQTQTGPPVLYQHSASVNALALLFDGHLASVDDNGMLFIDGTALAYPNPLIALAAHPTQPVLAIGDNRSRVVLLNTDGTTIWDKRFDNRAAAPAVTTLAFDMTGANVLVGFSNGQMRMVNTSSGEDRVLLAALDARIVGAVFLPDNLLALAAANRTLHLLDATTGQARYRFDIESDITALAGTGNEVITGAENETLRLWQVSNGAQIGSIPTEQRLSNIALSGDNIVTGGLGGTVDLWNKNSGQLLQRFDLPTNRPVSAVAFNRDGTLIAVGDMGGDVNLIPLFGERVRLGAHEDIILDIAFTPDGQVISASTDGTMILWDTSGTLIRQYSGHGGAVSSLAISSDGTRILSADLRGVMIVWDLTTGSEIRRFGGHSGAIRSVALNADSTQALSAGVDGTVRLWDVTNGVEIRRFEGHEGTVQQADFVAGHVVSAGSDGTVRVWTLTGDEIRRFEAGESIDAQVILDTLAVSGLRNDTLRVWTLLPTHASLLQWIGDHRYVAPLSCTQQLRFGVDGGFAQFGEQRFIPMTVPLLAAPDTNGGAVAMLDSGDSVRLLGQSGDFLHVCTIDGQSGYIVSN